MNKKRRYILLSLLLALFIAGGILLHQTLKSRPEISTNDSRVECTLVSIASKIAERITVIHVKEGDTVHKGDILAELDVQDLETKRAKAQANVALAQALYDKALSGTLSHEIEETRARVAEAEATYERAKRDFERIDTLFNDDAGISLSDRDAARATFLAAKAHVSASKETLALKEDGTREEEIRAAKAQLNLAQAELNTVNILYNEHKILSHTDGIVAQKLTSEGELVSTGQKLFTLIDNNDIWLNVRIEETEVGKLHLGQKVEFTLDGYPNDLCTGEIYEIGPAASSTFSLISTENASGYFTKVIQRIPVKVRLPQHHPHIVFRPGMQGEVIIFPVQP